MNDPAIITALIGTAMALVLALRGLRSYQLGSRRTLLFALAWVGIIAALALILGRFRA